MGHGSLAELTSPQAWASLEKLTNLPAMQETQIRSLGREDPLDAEIVLGAPRFLKSRKYYLL